MKGPYEKLLSILSETAMKGIIYDPNKNQGIEWYLDADFAGGWYIDDGQRAENVYLDLSMPYFMLGAQSYGQVNCKRKWLWAQQRLSILPCLQHFGKLSCLCIFYKSYQR